MEILYGLIMLIVFILGIVVGFVAPLLLKKYVQELINKNIKPEEEKEYQKVTSLTKDLIDEWQNGGEDDE